MSFTSLEHQLNLIERQFNEVSRSLIDGDPVNVETSSGALQQLAVDFVQMVDESGQSILNTPQLALRIKAISEGMPVLRESLIRRSAFVDRALQLVVPATQQTTYAASSGPYGGGFKQSGQMKVQSA
jgi:hypothetical protein